MGLLGKLPPTKDETRRMITCLLGAGASTESGPLISTRMAEEFFLWTFKGRAPPTPYDAKVPPSPLNTAGDIFFAVWNYLASTLNKQPNIEEIAVACWCIHPTSRSLGLYPPLLQVADPFKNLPAKEVEAIECDLIHRLKEEWIKVGEDKVNYLKKLIELESLFPEETLKIFTLNYDMTIETLCKKYSIGHTDGFRDGGLSFNSVPIFRDSVPEFYADPPLTALMWKGDDRTDLRPRVELFKLHGSVNWFKSVRVSSNVDDSYGIYHELRTLKKDGLTGIYDPNTPLVKLNQASEKVFWIDDEKNCYYPSMVFGTLNKMQPSLPYIRLYDLFYRYLRRAYVCIVIGYSFQDDYVNHILREAFNRQGNPHPFLNLIVVNIGKKASFASELGFKDEKRIWQLVGKTSNVLANSRFKNLVEDLSKTGKSDLPHILEFF